MQRSPHLIIAPAKFWLINCMIIFTQETFFKKSTIQFVARLRDEAIFACFHWRESSFRSFYGLHKIYNENWVYKICIPFQIVTVKR